MDSWSTYQNLPPDQVNWADLAQRWMAMRSAQDDHRPCADLNGYGGHFGSDSGPPTHYNRSIGYENYGRGDMNGQFHQAPDQNYGRGPERGLRDIGLHDNYQHDDWSSSTSGPNRPIFPAAAQTKSDVRNDFHDGFRGEWGGAPPPPPAHDHPEYYRTPNQPPNQYFQHDFAHGHPSSRNWSSSHPNGPPLRGGPAVGGPPLPSGAQLHGLTGTIGPPIRGSPPPGGPPPPGGNPPASGWYPSPFYPPPFASNVPNTTIASHHQSGAENSSTPPFFTMDASTRKKLPAWILEGLEKAEREKMKQIEKEERMKRAEEERAKRRVLAGKGRFDSSSEDEDEEQTDDERSRNKLRQSCSVNDDGEPVFLARRANLLADDPRTEEEKKDDAMATVKFIMMSLLMEATDEALRTSISDSIRDTKHEAEPKLLANSSALAALSSLGGGDESDDESDGEEKKENGNKSHNGGASSSSESGDENSVFKTPLGAPRKTSKQTTTSTEGPSTEAVSAGDGMDSVKTNLRRSAKNESGNNSSTGKSAEDIDSKRQGKSGSRERKRSRSGDRRRKSRERKRSSSRNRNRRSRSRERRRSRSPTRRERKRSRSRRRSTSRDRRRSRERMRSRSGDRRRSRSTDRKRSRSGDRKRSRSADRKRHRRERSAGRRERSCSRERRRR